MAIREQQRLTDILGRPITTGARIVYAAQAYRAQPLRTGTVQRIVRTADGARFVVLADLPLPGGRFKQRTVVLRDPRRIVVIEEDEASSWLRRQLAGLGEERGR